MRVCVCVRERESVCVRECVSVCDFQRTNNISFACV